MSKKYLVNLDLNKNELQNAKLHNLATAPSSPTTGQVYYNTADNKAYIYNGTSWIPWEENPANPVTGVKGNSESTYRTGNVNLTASNIGAASSSHTHGNITNAGALQTTDVAIADGDKLVVTDSSNSGKVARTSVAFDGTTNTKVLAKKGDWVDLPTGVSPSSTTPKMDGTATVGTETAFARGDHIHPSDTSKVTGNARVFFGSCTTSAETAEKAVSCSIYDGYHDGDILIVSFTHENTASTPKLNVNSKGAKRISIIEYDYRGSGYVNWGDWGEGDTVVFRYDTGIGVWIALIDTDTIYSGGTQSQLETGTGTTNYLWSPKILHDYVSTVVGGVDAMRFKGTVNSNSDLPTTGVKVGDTYMVNTAGTYAGQTCEVGDLIIATATTPTWTVAQTNISGAVTASTTTTNGYLAKFTGDRIVANGPSLTPASAVSGGTDPTLVTTGDMYTWNHIADDKAVGNGRIFYGTCSTGASTPAKVVTCSDYDEIQAGDIVLVSFSYPNTAGSPTLNINSTGSKSIKQIYKGDYTNLKNTSSVRGLSVFVFSANNWILVNTNDDTTYGTATTSSNGLMSSTDKTNLDSLNTTFGGLRKETLTISVGNTSVSTSTIINMLSYTAVHNGEEVVVDYDDEHHTFSIATAQAYPVTINCIGL